MGKCPYTCWTCQDGRRWNAQPFHTGRAIRWPDAPGALQHRPQHKHQSPRVQHPAHEQSCTCCMNRCLQVALPAKDTSALPPYHSHVMALSPNYLCWSPRSNLPSHLHYKPRTGLLQRRDIWNGTIEPLAPAIHLVPKCHSVTKKYLSPVIKSVLSPLFIRLKRLDQRLLLQELSSRFTSPAASFRVHLPKPVPGWASHCSRTSTPDNVHVEF